MTLSTGWYCHACRMWKTSAKAVMKDAPVWFGIGWAMMVLRS